MLRTLLKRIRLWYWMRLYRPGRVVSKFLAPDIRRDVDVVDASRIAEGVICARIRTWNVLYAIKGIAAEPPFGEAREIAIMDLWTWTGELWGGPVPDSTNETV